MPYVYRHIRLDKNQPFYIGISKKDSPTYKRAYTTYSRNKHWHSIVKKTDYEVDILFSNVSYEFAKQKEIEFIKFYGRQDLGTGILVNMTDGGDGNTNWSLSQRDKHIQRNKGRIVSEETKRKLSESHKGYKPTAETLLKMSISAKKNVISAETREKMAAKLKGRKHPDWFCEMMSAHRKGKPLFYKRIPIMQFDLNGKFIKEFDGLVSAQKEVGGSVANLHKAVSGQRGHHKEYVWVYKNDNFDESLEQVKYRLSLIKRRKFTKIKNILNDKIYNSLKEACLDCGYVYGTVKGELSRCKNYKKILYYA